MNIAYETIWGERRGLKVARQALRRDALTRRVNNEAYRREWESNRMHYHDYKTAEDRVGIKYQSPLLKYLFILGFMATFVYFTSALIGSM